MKLPKSCKECILCDKKIIAGFNHYSCKPLNKTAFINGKRDDCPIVEIPTPHGRMIDADKLELPLGWQGEIVKATLKESSTIIEAEG